MGEASARFLEAIQPGRDSIDADELDYPDLSKIIKQYQVGTRRWHAYGNPFRRYVSPTYEELTDVYLLQIAYRLQKSRLPAEKKFWSKRYTKTSVNLYGEPSPDETSMIATLELAYFKDSADFLHDHGDFLKLAINGYTQLATHRTPVLSLEKRYRLILGKVHDYFFENYEEALACFDRFAPNKMLEPGDVAGCFSDALEVLARTESAWNDWSVVYDDSARLSVDIYRSEINIGKYRATIPYSEVKGLFAHEVLVHAMRCVNGSKISDKLAYGLPGYLEAEEGFGVLVESAVNGRVANKVKDRYIDIALALGDEHRSPMTRQELFGVCYSRAVARNITETKDFDLNRLEDHTWEHVNRIYRGTLGNDYVGVFTKDIAYYQGFCKIANYLLHILAQEKPIKVGVEYLLKGKFDPLDQIHIEYVHTHDVSTFYE
jgi:hypothetical protein